MHPAALRWQELLGRLDRWFENARAQHPGVIPCHKGCSACCHGPFDITVADGLLLREAIGALPEAERATVRQRGLALLARIRRLAPDWRAPWDLQALEEHRFDAISEELAAEPCPLLDDEGACRVYAHRPLVCRMMGLPMMTAAGIVLENACPIQEQFPGYAAIDPQLFDLEALEAIEKTCLEDAAVALFDSPLHHGYETTIAVIAAE
ncbi:MAG TPA: YkgJ family cysteine cluster protein [Gemmatimonadales bacterium]|nr:YkgJ family cysteine cluster protein [Gemmatimonadales bacterium]